MGNARLGLGRVEAAARVLALERFEEVARFDQWSSHLTSHLTSWRLSGARRWRVLKESDGCKIHFPTKNRLHSRPGSKFCSWMIQQGWTHRWIHNMQRFTSVGNGRSLFKISLRFSFMYA